MESIPAEIFNDVFSLITDLSDWLNLRAVNKFFHEIFTPIAFRTMRFQGSQSSLSRFIALASSDLAPWVESITLDLSAPSVVVENKETSSAETSSSSLGSITAFRNARSLSLRFHYAWSKQGRIPPNIVLRAFARSGLTITSLQITNFAPSAPDPYYGNPEFQLFLRDLDRLSITGGDLSRAVTASQIWLKAIGESLTELVLEKGRLGSVVETNLKFSKLKRLELRKLGFQGPSPSLEAFIVYATPSVEDLVLSGCSVPPPNASTGDRSWANVIDLLRSGLPKLKRFRIKSPLYYTPVECLAPNIISDTIYHADLNAVKALWQSLNHSEPITPHDSELIVLPGPHLDTFAYPPFPHYGPTDSLLDSFNFSSFMLGHEDVLFDPPSFPLNYLPFERALETWIQEADGESINV